MVAKSVYKYQVGLELPRPGLYEVTMPRGARVLSAGLQPNDHGGRESIVVWALVDMEAPVEAVTFLLAFTGAPLHRKANMDRMAHVATLTDRAGLVWHVFAERRYVERLYG